MAIGRRVGGETETPENAEMGAFKPYLSAYSEPDTTTANLGTLQQSSYATLDRNEIGKFDKMRESIYFLNE